MLTIVAVRAIPPATIEFDLSDGNTLTIDATGIISSCGYEPLIAPDQFAAVAVSDWGHGIEWPAIDQGFSIETLIRLVREQAGTAFPTVDFNTWMKRNGLTLTTAAQALGLSRRTIIYYNTGRSPSPSISDWPARGGRRVTAARPHRPGRRFLACGRHPARPLGR